MPATIRAAIAGLFILEVSGAFLLGFVSLVLFTLHVTGVIFWGVEAVTALVALYLSGLFFMSALKYERSVGLVRYGDDQD